MKRGTGWRHVAIWAVLALAGTSAAASAQSLTTGTLVGMVRDEVGAPMFDVSVTVVGSSGGVPRVVPTSRDGRFEFEYLPPGTYDIIAERLGFRPRRVTGVVVFAGRQAEVSMDLLPSETARVDEADVQPWDGGTSAAYSGGLAVGTTREVLERMAGSTRELADVARLSSALGPDLSVRGLPGTYSGFLVDGIPVRGARHPLLGAGSNRSTFLRLSAFDQVQVVHDEGDVEFSNFAGALIVGQGRRGGREFGVDVWAEGSAGALSTSTLFEAADAGGASLQGGAVINGPIVADTAHFLAGIELIRNEVPRAALLDPTLSGAAQPLLDRLGDGYAALGEPFAARSHALTAFGSVDWQVAEAHRVFTRVDFANISAGEPDLPGGGPVATSSGSDLLAAGGVTSRIGDFTALEFRFGLDRSSRDYELATDAPATPYTVLAGSSLAFGSPQDLAGSFRTSSLTITETLLHRADMHQWKFGAGANLATHERTVGPLTTAFLFSDASGFETRSGYFRRATATSQFGSFSTRRFFAFLQDRWRTSPELELLFGLRGELERLPLDDIALDAEWEALSGLANARVVEQPSFRASPRFGFTLDLGGEGRYFLRGSAGVYHDVVDPDILAQVLTETGNRSVEYRTGSLNAWPGDATGGEATTMKSLSILAPKFRAPRSERGSVGIGLAVGAGVSFDLSGGYSRTTGLPRRTDLNLLPGVTGRDQANRPIYGELVQNGSLLYALPGSNRRFTDYDNVYALSSDGEAESLHVSAGLERNVTDGAAFFVRYTFTRTTDDWLNSGLSPRGAALSPFAGDEGWLDGTGDLDVPHRMVAGLDLSLPNLPFRITGFYRFESGRPFTPGFGPGVDANGDGVFGNDPAFVGNVPGVSEIVARWSCLNDETDGFISRNACREPDTHRIDVRVSADLPAGERGRLAVFAEALNLADSEIAVRDHALYRVDSNGSIDRDAATGRVTVPLVANPGFGEPLAILSSGRMLRLGLQVRF